MVLNPPAKRDVRVTGFSSILILSSKKLKNMEDDYEWYFDESATQLAIEGIEIQKLDSVKVIGLIVKDKKTDRFDRVLLWKLENHTIVYSQRMEELIKTCSLSSQRI